MHKDSIIETIRDKSHPFNQHIASVTGVPYIPAPTYYRNKENGESYYSLTGALAFPSGRMAGFAVVIAAMKEDGSAAKPRFKVLDETEASSIEGLLKSCVQMRRRWHYPELLNFFYGDYERYMTVLTEFNLQLEQSQERGLYLAPPADFQQPNRTEIYLERIRAYLMKDENGQKRLNLGTCDKLRIHLQKMPVDASKLQIEDFPAVAAFGYALHFLPATRPWLVHAESDRTIKTYGDSEVEDYDRVAENIISEASIWWNEYKNFDLKGTC